MCDPPRPGHAEEVATPVERRARNEAIFRDANERIRDAHRELGAPVARVPFLCECPDEHCRHIVRLAPEAYEEVRANPERFVVAPGHEEDAAEVDAGDGYVVIEKSGAEAALVRELDPRGGCDGGRP
jgi:hypothetical protein